MIETVKKVLAGGALLASFGPPASALTQDITARFIPDSANPMKNEFVNTTTETGMCPWHMPARCKQLGIFSIRVDGFSAQTQRSIYPLSSDPRQSAMWKVPSEWRDVEVRHTQTGDSQTVQVRIAAFGHAWRAWPGSSAWSIPGRAWQAQWKYPPAPCVRTDFLTGNSRGALFFWLVPEGAGICSLQPGTEVTSQYYDTFEYAYAMRTPNPLNMSSGQYTGSIRYSMGPGGDFDFGDNFAVTAGGNEFIFNFDLDVQHALRVEVPPGGNKVELVPEGGWQAWLMRSRRPERLFRDQTFNLSASSRFKMELECQYPNAENTCSLQETVTGHAVPLNISVSLPGGMTDTAGQPVSRRPLLLDGSGTELFQPGFYVDRKPGVLHFEVGRSAVSEMLAGDARRYSGNVTVVWDSDI